MRNQRRTYQRVAGPGSDGLGLRVARRVLRPGWKFLTARVRSQLSYLHAEVERTHQQVRYLALANLLSRVDRDPNDLTPFELSVFSQNGEDGVLQEILRRVKTTERYFVEIGAEPGEANCLFLCDVLGWHGLFMDADEAICRALTQKYRGVPAVKVVQTFVTPENISSLLKQAGCPVEIDVVSIDIDGNDYWVWESLSTYCPRVVIIEYNSGLDPSRYLVQPYDLSRVWDRQTNSFGASLGAVKRLAATKGYRLVHVELTGTNAFFVREDLAAGRFAADWDGSNRPQSIYLTGVSYAEPDVAAAFIELGEGDEN
jgi:hypothetical protein